MKIRITLAGNDRTVLILPLESAGIAAQLLASAAVFERDGYYSTSGWKRSEEGIRIEYTDAAELEPTSEATKKAQEEGAKHQKQWLDEYNKRTGLEKQVIELSAALEELRARTVCVADEPKPEVEPEPVTVDESNDNDDLPL